MWCVEGEEDEQQFAEVWHAIHAQGKAKW